MSKWATHLSTSLCSITKPLPQLERAYQQISPQLTTRLIPFKKEWLKSKEKPGKSKRSALLTAFEKSSSSPTIPTSCKSGSTTRQPTNYTSKVLYLSLSSMFLKYKISTHPKDFRCFLKPQSCVRMMFEVTCTVWSQKMKTINLIPPETSSLAV